MSLWLLVQFGKINCAFLKVFLEHIYLVLVH